MLLAKVLNLFILSQCNFCSLIGMSCNKMLQNKMKQIQKPVLLIVYSDPSLNLDEFVERDKRPTVHTKTF